MKIEAVHQVNGSWQKLVSQPGFSAASAQLVLVFGSRALITETAVFSYLREHYPKAQIALSSTSGEIVQDEVFDQSIVATAIEFQQSLVCSHLTNINRHEDSFHAGKYLRSCFKPSGLKMLFVLSDGTLVNGSELVQGLTDENFGSSILISGGLAGDGEKFEQTVVGLNEPPAPGNIVAIGFYGDHLQVECGSFGGWDEFGPKRVVTHAHKNILYEIDGRKALDLYKEYLGPFVSELPGSALLFPLSVQFDDQPAIVRTILSIDEANQSMTFAGNIPVGSTVRLMKANFERLIQASQMAAGSMPLSALSHPSLAILVSCVGRKMILRQRTYEEIHAVRKILGSHTHITGFYSYGEISPRFNTPGTCDLQNQTMTITLLSEESN